MPAVPDVERGAAAAGGAPPAEARGARAGAGPAQGAPDAAAPGAVAVAAPTPLALDPTLTGAKFKDAPPELVMQLLKDGRVHEADYDNMPLAIMENPNAGQSGHPKAQAPQRTRVDIYGPNLSRPMGRHHHNPWTPPAQEEDAVPGLLSVLTPAVVFGHRGRRNEWSAKVPEPDRPSKKVASKYCLGEFLDGRHTSDGKYDVETHGVYEGTYFELLNSLQALLAYLEGLANVPPLLDLPEEPIYAELVLPPYKPPTAEADPPEIEEPDFEEPDFEEPAYEPMPAAPDADLLPLPEDPGPRPPAYRPAEFRGPARDKVKAFVAPEQDAMPDRPALEADPEQEQPPSMAELAGIGPAPEHPGDAPADIAAPPFVEPELPPKPAPPPAPEALPPRAPTPDAPVSDDEPMPARAMTPKPELRLNVDHIAASPRPVCELCGDPGHTAPFCPRGKEPCARCGRPYQSERCTVCGEFGHIAEFCPVDRCARCGECGHTAKECPDKNRCARCGDPGHTAAVCPRRPELCTRCGKEGHRAKFCPRDRCVVCGEYEPKPEPCTLCGEMGHTAAFCPNGPIPCTLCGKMGHTAPFCPDAVCRLCGDPGHTEDVCPTMRCGKCGDQGHRTEDCPRVHTHFPVYHRADSPISLNWEPPFEEVDPKYPAPPEIAPPPFDGLPPGAPPEPREPDDLEAVPPFVEPEGDWDAGPAPQHPELREPNYPDPGPEPEYEEEPDFVPPMDDELPVFVPPTAPRPIGYIAAKGRWWGYAPCMIFDHSGTMRFRLEDEQQSRFEDLRECQELIFSHSPPLLGQLHASCAAFDCIVFTHGSWSFAYDAAGLASRAAKDRALYDRHLKGERLPRGAGATWSGYSSGGRGTPGVSDLMYGAGNTQYRQRGTSSTLSGAHIASADGIGSDAVVSKRAYTPETTGVDFEPLADDRSYLRHSSSRPGSSPLDTNPSRPSSAARSRPTSAMARPSSAGSARGGIWPSLPPSRETASMPPRAGHRITPATGASHPMLNFNWESHKNPPVECSPMMLDAAKQWLFRWPNARGASNMLGALIKGLESSPEAIYLFSDGLADSRKKVIELVEAYVAADRCPPIHSIGFQCNAMGENLLRTLGEMSGGSFQHYERQSDWMARTSSGLSEHELAEQKWADEMMGFEMAKCKESGGTPDPEAWRKQLEERHHRERVLPTQRRNEMRQEQARIAYDDEIAQIRRRNDALKRAYERGVAAGREAAEAEVRDENKRLMDVYHAQLYEWQAKKDALDAARDRAFQEALAAYNESVKDIRARNQVKRDACQAEFEEAMKKHNAEVEAYEEALRKHKQDYEERLRVRREELAEEQRRRHEEAMKKKEARKAEEEAALAAAAEAAGAAARRRQEQEAASGEARAAEQPPAAAADSGPSSPHPAGTGGLSVPTVQEVPEGDKTPRSQLLRVDTTQMTDSEALSPGESDRLKTSPDRLEGVQEHNREELHSWRASNQEAEDEIEARNRARAERRASSRPTSASSTAGGATAVVSTGDPVADWEVECAALMAKARADHEAKVAEVQRQNELQRAEYEEKLEEYMTANRRYNDLMRKQQRELKRLREEFEAARDEREMRYAKKLVDVRQRNEARLREWEDRCKEVEARNKAAYDEEHAKWKEKKELVEKLNNEAEKVARAEYDEIERKKRMDADVLLEEWENAMSAIKKVEKENNRRLSVAEAEHKKLIAAAEARNEALRLRALKEHNLMVQRLKEEALMEYNQMVANRNELIKALRKSHEARCRKAESQYANYIEIFKQKFEEEQEALRLAYEARLREVEETNAERMPGIRRAELAQIEMWRVTQFLRRIKERAGTCLERVVEPITINTALDRAWPEGREHIPWSRHLKQEWPKPILKPSPVATLKMMEDEDDVRKRVSTADRPKTIKYHNISGKRPPIAAAEPAPEMGTPVPTPAPIDEDLEPTPERPLSSGMRVDRSALQRPHTAAGTLGMRPKSARPLSVLERPSTSTTVSATQRFFGEGGRPKPISGSPLSSKRGTPEPGDRGRSKATAKAVARAVVAAAPSKGGAFSVARRGRSRWYVDETAYEAVDLVEVWTPDDY